MVSIHRFASLLAGCLLALATTAANAQNWPEKPVRVLVPYPPGGIGDTATRAITTRLAGKLGQPFVVENMPGGNQIVATQTAAKAAPDGHTLVLVSPTSLVLNPLTRRSLPYNADRLALVSRTFSSPFFLIVEPKLPVANVAELVVLAKAKPRALAYGSLGEGSSAHLAAELFAQTAGIQMTHVPYKGTAQSNIDLMNGTLQLIFFPGAGSIPLINDGRLRALAVTGGQRSPALPSVPTMVEAGIRGYDVHSWWGFATSEGTPKAITEKIAAAVAQAIADPTLAPPFRAQGVEFVAETPEEFNAFYREEKGRWGPLVKALNIPME